MNTPVVKNTHFLPNGDNIESLSNEANLRGLDLIRMRNTGSM
jgi:hypothetical protein